VSGEKENFCCECGAFLRDAYIDQKLLFALQQQTEGNDKEARRALERLIEDDPNHVLANHLLGNLYFHQGTLEKAIKCYRAALKQAPEFLQCIYDLGVAWYHHANMKEAIRAFQKCLNIDPHYNAAHYRLGIALFHTGEIDAALEHYEIASSLTPEYRMALYQIGIVHERKSDSASAARAFQQSVDEAVGEASSFYHLAQIRRAEGKEEEARELLERAAGFKALDSVE
jgi:tetratricopeptide (TPR) repeat protein